MTVEVECFNDNGGLSTRSRNSWSQCYDTHFIIKPLWFEGRGLNFLWNIIWKQQAKDSFDRKQPNNGWVSGMHAMTVSYAMVCICNKENKHVMHDAIMLADHPIVMVHNLLKS